MNQLRTILTCILTGFGSLIFGQTITVNFQQPFQTIEGWENGTFLPPGLENYVIDDLVNLTVDSLGINRLRLEVRSGSENSADNYQLYQDSLIDYDTWRSMRYATVNDNEDPDSIHWAGFHFTELDEKIENILIPIRNRLIQNQESLYINLCFVAFTDQLNGGMGGQIIQQNPDEYAEFIEAIFLHMDSTYGFVPDAVEVILEPNVASFGNGTLVGQCLVAAGDQLANHGYHPDFVACSNTNLIGAINMYPSFTAVPGVSAYWTEYSFHAYAGRTDDNLMQIASYGAASGVNTSMLEWWANGNTYSYLHDCLTLANVSSYQFKGSFGAVDNDWNSGLLHIVDNGNNQYTLDLQPPVKYYRHYFDLIQRGAVRYAAYTDHDQYKPVVFINPDGNIILNIDAASSGSVEVSGLPPGVYQSIYSLGDGKKEPNPYWEKRSPDTLTAGQSLILNIPGQGIFSVVQQASFTSRTQLIVDQNIPFSIQANRGEIIVSGTDEALVNHVAIYAINGQLVKEQSHLAHKSAMLECSGALQGVYIVHVNRQFSIKVYIP